MTKPTDIRCAKMTRADLPAAAHLLKAFFAEDEFYRDSSGAYGDAGSAPVERALEKFIARPEIGFVWLAFRGGEAAAKEAVAMCVICYAISTSLGDVVGKLDDVFVADGARGQGVGSAMLRALAADLKAAGVLRIDSAVHVRNAEAARFYARLGFRPLNEERIAWLL
jgi:ribosomal protein S18 acetylase RimI-like enzyme